MSSAAGAPGSVAACLPGWHSHSAAAPSDGSRGRWDLINYRSCSCFTRLFDRVVSSARHVFHLSFVVRSVLSPRRSSFAAALICSFARLALRCDARRPLSTRRRNEFLPRHPSVFAARDSFKQINVITSRSTNSQPTNLFLPTQPQPLATSLCLVRRQVFE